MITNAIKKLFQDNDHHMRALAEKSLAKTNGDTVTDASESDLMLEMTLAMKNESLAVETVSATMNAGHKTTMSIVANIKA